MAFRIMLAGGGSGGHVFPLVAIAEEIQRLAPEYHENVKIRFIGAGRILEKSASAIGIACNLINAPKLRRYKSWQNFFDILKIPVAFFQSVVHVWSFMPDVMLIKGGYASFFPALAAKLMFIPIVVHESDSIPGRTNMYWERHARKVFVAFDHAEQYFKSDKVEKVGNPIRSALLQPRQKQQMDKPTVFITGGSQGAQAINEVVDLAKFELEKKFHVIHQPDGSWSAQQMAQAYADADVIVSRAGSAIFEIAFFGKPAILIPLEGSAQEHQLSNAEEFAGHGAVILPQANLTPHILIDQIEKVYENRVALGNQIKNFSIPDASTVIAKELLSAKK